MKVNPKEHPVLLSWFFAINIVYEELSSLRHLLLKGVWEVSYSP